MRRCLLLLLLLALAGCAQAIKDPPPPPDMFQVPPPFLSPDMNLGGPPPGDAGGLPPPPLPDMGGLPPPPQNCNPGMRLGLCKICSPEGRPVPTPEDPACPAADCSAFDAFMLVQEGGVPVCVRVGRRPTGGNCTPIGDCHVGDANYCDAIDRTEVVRADECKTIMGCAGEEGPEVMPAPEGTACPGGVCRADGTCDTEEVGACEDFDLEENAACRGGQDIGGDDFCEFTFADVNCVDACVSLGGFCLRAWQGAGECTPGMPISCLESRAQRVVPLWQAVSSDRGNRCA